MPHVTVVVPTYNGAQLLKPCLDSLEDSINIDARVLVVDDGSTDNTRSVLAEYPWVHLVATRLNHGFASAANRGIAAAPASRYVALLNNDTVVEPDWLDECLSFLDRHPSVGSCAPLVRFMSDPNTINSAGIDLDWSGVARERHGGRSYRHRDREPTEVFGASGAAVVFRRRLLDEVGPFEPRFHAYLEDVDLAWRARRAGWTAVHLPTSQVRHHHSATSRQGSAFKAYLLSRNRLWLLLRNASLRQLLEGAPRSVAFDLGTIAFNILTRRSLAPLRGKFAALHQPPPIARVRRAHPMLPRSAFSEAASYRSLLVDRLKRDRLSGDT